MNPLPSDCPQNPRGPGDNAVPFYDYDRLCCAIACKQRICLAAIAQQSQNDL